MEPDSTTSSVIFRKRDGDVPPSSGAETPGKCHDCRTGVQFQDFYVNGRPTGGKISIFLQSELAMQLCDLPGLEVTQSYDTGVPPLPSEVNAPVNASMPDSEFLAILAESDPSSLELMPYLEAYPPANEGLDSNYRNEEMEASNYDLCSGTSKMYDRIMVEPMVSETQGARPPMKVSREVYTLSSKHAPLSFHQAKSTVLRDGADGGPVHRDPEVLDAHDRGVPTESDGGNTLTKKNLPCIPDNPGVLAISSSNTAEGPYYTAFPASTNDDSLFIYSLASDTQGLPSSVESELEVNPNPMWERSVTQHPPPPKILYSSLASSSEVASKSNCTRLEVERNTVYRRIGEQHQGLSRKRLLIEKELTLSDVGRTVSGVNIPRRTVEKYFGAIPKGSQGHAITMHDAVTAQKTWIMRLTVCLKVTGRSERTPVYSLKDSWEYVKYHALEEGDYFQIFWEDPGNRCIVKFERRASLHYPPPHQTHLFGKTWKLVIRKRLTETDAFVGLRCFGAIRVDKNKAEKHFPPMDNRGGVKMIFLDWENKETWPITLNFATFAKGRVYQLYGTAAFCKFHHLLKDDYVDIFKSDEPDASYALRACKLDDRV